MSFFVVFLLVKGQRSLIAKGHFPPVGERDDFELIRQENNMG